MTPLYKTVAVDIHQPHLWKEGYLIGDGQSVVYIKSYTDNHAIYSDSNVLVTTGSPANFEPGESKQPFESHFQIEKGIKYHTNSYVIIYALEPTQITFEKERYGSPMMVVFSVIILFFSTLVAIGQIVESFKR